VVISLFAPKNIRTDSHVYAEYLRERIYGLLTLMAVNTSMLMSEKAVTVRYAMLTIIITTSGLWAASMIAAYVSFRIAHDIHMPNYHLTHELSVHRGLLWAGVPSIVMLCMAAFGWIEVSTALLCDVALAGSGLLVSVWRSAKTQHNSYRDAVILSVIQLAVVAAIVAVKSAAK
jgi:hypothetical protein